MSEQQKFTFNKGAKEYKPKDTFTSRASNIAVNNGNIGNKIQDDLNNIKFNLEAKEFKPKPMEINGYTIGGLDSDDEDVDVKLNQNNNIKDKPEIKVLKANPVKEKDDTANDLDIEEIIEQGLDDYDDEESDGNEWVPQFKNCSCCKGYINKCSGVICSSLGVCYCKAQEEFDPEMKN